MIELNTIVRLIILILAADALLMLWFLGGGFVAVYRAYAQAWSAIPGKSILGAIGYGATCRLCLSFHVTVVLYVLLLAVPFWEHVLYVLAAAGTVFRLTGTMVKSTSDPTSMII